LGLFGGRLQHRGVEFHSQVKDIDTTSTRECDQRVQMLVPGPGQDGKFGNQSVLTNGRGSVIDGFPNASHPTVQKQLRSEAPSIDGSTAHGGAALLYWVFNYLTIGLGFVCLYPVGLFLFALSAMLYWLISFSIGYWLQGDSLNGPFKDFVSSTTQILGWGGFWICGICVLLFTLALCFRVEDKLATNSVWYRKVRHGFRLTAVFVVATVSSYKLWLLASTSQQSTWIVSLRYFTPLIGGIFAWLIHYALQSPKHRFTWSWWLVRLGLRAKKDLHERVWSLSW
jgi:hypothetical protein